MLPLRRLAQVRGVRSAALVRPKSTTGIVGLPVEPNAKAILEDMYAKTLSQLEDFPKESAYRMTVEAMTKERLEVVKSDADIPVIENQIGAGQIEQLIQQAKDELSLMPLLAEARVWEEYEGTPAEEIYGDLKRRGVALQRHDIPMRQSQDYPTAEQVELIAPAPAVEGS